MAYRILSLSGGGVRGLFQAVFLNEIHKRIRKPLCECFDLVAGTSTGAIIAMGVAFGIEPVRMADLFRNEGPKIFSPRRFTSFRKGPRYSQQPLRLALQNVFTTSLFKDAKCDVLITASTLDTFQCRAFTTLDGRDHTNPEAFLTAADITLASSAAPTYFPSVQPVGASRNYVDGGLWANDPSFLAVTYAHQKRQVDFKDMRLVNLGNGTQPNGQIANEFNSQRPVSPSIITTMFEMMFAMQSGIAKQYCEAFLDKRNIFQADAILQELVQLDDVTSAISVLPAHAEQAAQQRLNELVAFLEINDPPKIAPPGGGGGGGGGGRWGGGLKAPREDF